MSYIKAGIETAVTHDKKHKYVTFINSIIYINTHIFLLSQVVLSGDR